MFAKWAQCSLAKEKLNKARNNVSICKI